jgi:hypothetical protein
MRDFVSNIGPVASIVPAVQAASANGAAVDLLGFNGAALVINTGAVAGSGDYAIKLQESDTTADEDFDDVAASDLIGTLPATLEASKVYKQGYIGNCRYVRAVITKASGTSIAAGAIIVKGRPASAPVA